MVTTFGATTAMLESVALPRLVDPSRKETDPPGIGTVVVWPLTIALMLTLCPTFAVVGVAAAVVVEVCWPKA